MNAAKLIRRRASVAELQGDLHPLLRRIYSRRGVSELREIELELANLVPPDSLKGLGDAVALLVEALRGQWRVLLVGDYDADGAASCAIALDALNSFGFDNLDYIVPNRFDYGYGLTPAIVELASARWPDLLITVDNGISSIEGVDAAKIAGMRVIVTDHHLPGKQLPAADAIVNPNQPGCDFPAKNCAGVGVIFYVMLGLRGRLRELGWFSAGNLPEPNMAELLDLVAIGTVADVVSFDLNNRILVSEGLRRIRAGRARLGIRALMKAAGRNPAKVAADLAFGVAPRLNAAGRMTDMSIGIECLLAEDRDSAEQLASELDALNRDRKEIQAEMNEQAEELVAKLTTEAAVLHHPVEAGGHAAAPALDPTGSVEKLPAGLCIYQPGWHEGVIGIVAARIKDRLHRPAIVFADSQGQLKGSGRSIGGFHLLDALRAVDDSNPGLMAGFGGHAMAAGLSLETDKFERFRAAFESEAERRLQPEQFAAKVYSDGRLEPQWFSLQVAQMLRNAGPWGKDFPEPVFDGEFLLREQRVLKEKHLRMELSPKDDLELRVGAIAFNVERWPDPEAGEISLAYRLDINEFRGVCKLQLVVEEILSVSATAERPNGVLKRQQTGKYATKRSQGKGSRGRRFTTAPGFKNSNGQVVIEATDLRGNDYNQYVYVLQCSNCQYRYGSNGSDNWQRKCPRCQGGAPGLPYR